ncbi:MAG: AmmeMemoRadiSam system radical SAM enzyme [Desulfobacterota bacterium]|nr:AmmeMemoRadiSam system radical SAM enzyme [Thermodesulfobacteriota bacterium]
MRPSPLSPITRRDFLFLWGRCLACLSGAAMAFLPKGLSGQGMKKGLIRPKLSPFYSALGGGEVRCELCPHRCQVSKGRRGLCKVRENRDGKYYSLVYGTPAALHLDPVERNPFFHVHPGSNALSVATAGCNFQCKFCQTWEMSQASPEEIYSHEASPETTVRMAKTMGARAIAYTYTEPTIFFEYMLDTATLGRREGLLNLLQSNGFINPQPLQRLCQVLDAANIDLKGFSESFYSQLCQGELSPVLETLKRLKKEGIHLEITNLVIPMQNDELEAVREMCLWIKRELGSDTPVHFSRFYPLYKLRTLPPTPISTLEKVRALALSTGLEYVYIAKVPGHEAENTFCPRCKKLIIQRTGFMVGEVQIKSGKCRFCGRPIPGIWT